MGQEPPLDIEILKQNKKPIKNYLTISGQEDLTIENIEEYIAVHEIFIVEFVDSPKLWYSYSNRKSFIQKVNVLNTIRKKYDLPERISIVLTPQANPPEIDKKYVIIGNRHKTGFHTIIFVPLELIKIITRQSS